MTHQGAIYYNTHRAVYNTARSSIFGKHAACARNFIGQEVVSLFAIINSVIPKLIFLVNMICLCCLREFLHKLPTVA